MYTQTALFSDEVSQRWHRRYHYWLPTSAYSHFNPAEYEVVETKDEKLVRKFLGENHYLPTFPAMSKRYLLYMGELLVGVAVLGIPVNKRVLRVFPDLLAYKQALELSRFALSPIVPPNGESWFWARCRELALRDGIQGIISFSDPQPYKRLDGSWLSPGHVGRIYQAGNGLYIGPSDARSVLVLPTGQVLHERMLQKIRAEESGHDYAENLLRLAGAPARSLDESPRDWLKRVLRMLGASRTKAPGKHRYVFLQGNRREIAALQKRLPPTFPYPRVRIDQAIQPHLIVSEPGFWSDDE